MSSTKLFIVLAACSIAASFLFISSVTTPEVLPAQPLQSVVAPISDKQQPVELGAVHWCRSLDSGLVEARKTGKLALILFQEVPGCSNCTGFGNNTLSHPLIVEAIEDLFIPICIYNNKNGADKVALERFGEPAWNNPVVRIVQANGADVVLRMPDFRSSRYIVNGMRRALDLTNQTVPQYLDLLEEELQARETGLETATFQMYCFWSGESTFGAIPGVIETEPGFQDGHEVVQVRYNPNRIKKEDLAQLTQPKGIQSCSKNEGFRSDREPKYYLSHTDWKSVPMTSLQACRANNFIGQNQSPECVLSPRQIALYHTLSGQPKGAKPNLIGEKDLAAAWKQVRR